MTALSADRAKVQLGDGATPRSVSYGVAASTTIYAGGMVALNAAGYAVPASDDKALRVVGVAQDMVDNSSGSNGDKTVAALVGAFRMANSASTEALTRADVGYACFAADDQTVSRTPTADNSSPVAGTVAEVTSDGVFVRVSFNQAGSARSYAVVTATDDALTGSSQTEVIAEAGYLPAGSMVMAEVDVTEAFTAAAGAGLILIGDGSDADAFGSVDAESTGKTVVGPVFSRDGGTLTYTFDAGSGETPADFSAGVATITAVAIQAS